MQRPSSASSDVSAEASGALAPGALGGERALQPPYSPAPTLCALSSASKDVPVETSGALEPGVIDGEPVLHSLPSTSVCCALDATTLTVLAVRGAPAPCVPSQSLEHSFEALHAAPLGAAEHVAQRATSPMSVMDGGGPSAAVDSCAMDFGGDPVLSPASDKPQCAARMSACIVDQPGADCSTQSEAVRHGAHANTANAAPVAEGAKPVARGLAMGSADPHLVGSGADNAPRAKRGAAFDPIAHLSASEVELRRRPLPAANTPPDTEPLPPPEAPLPAPIVTRVEQVVPARTLSRIKRWIRQLRRCLRFAAQGNHRMARKLRPDDLWLPHDEHSMPETAAWDWDLRPLVSGERAVPMEPSGRDGRLPAGPMAEPAVRAAVRAAAVEFGDQAIVSEMLQGIRDDATCARGTLLCAPHSGALRLYQQAHEKLLKTEQRGWGTGGWELPAWPLRASPYSVVDESERAGKPKFRLTNDLSWPHEGMIDDGTGGSVESINGSMARDRWPRNGLPRAAKTGESAAILQSSGAPVAVWGLDGEAYYRAFGRQRSELWRNAIAMMEGFQLDERCCFGSAADATKCSRASNLIAHAIKRALRAVDAAHPTRDPRVAAWLAEREQSAVESGCSAAEAKERYASLHACSMYIDDATGASINDLLFDANGEPVMRDGQQLRRAQLHFEAAVRTLESFGVASSPDKEQPPGDSVESLGLKIDLAEGRMRILEVRRKAYAAKAAALAKANVCVRTELISVLSKLLFAASCYPAGRPWLDAAWRAARAQYSLEGDRVLLSRKAKEGLSRWAHTLSSEMADGVPLAHACFPAFGAAGCGAIYADASGRQGWSAWTVKGEELLLTSGEWTADELGDESFIIAEKELLASTLGLVALAPVANLSFVYQFTDNTVAEAAMRRLAPRTPRMQAMVAARSAWMRQRGVFESAERISTHANLWADLGSRQAVGEVVRQAALLGLSTRHVPAPPEWRATEQLRALNVYDVQ